jgi:hypothetical protein
MNKQIIASFKHKIQDAWASKYSSLGDSLAAQNTQLTVLAQIIVEESREKRKLANTPSMDTVLRILKNDRQQIQAGTRDWLLAYMGYASLADFERDMAQRKPIHAPINGSSNDHQSVTIAVAATKDALESLTAEIESLKRSNEAASLAHLAEIQDIKKQNRHRILILQAILIISCLGLYFTQQNHYRARLRSHSMADDITESEFQEIQRIVTEANHLEFLAYKGCPDSTQLRWVNHAFAHDSPRREDIIGRVRKRSGMGCSLLNHPDSSFANTVEVYDVRALGEKRDTFNYSSRESWRLTWVPCTNPQNNYRYKDAITNHGMIVRGNDGLLRVVR